MIWYSVFVDVRIRGGLVKIVLKGRVSIRYILGLQCIYYILFWVCYSL